jgi:predicted nucleotidyltransferase
MTPIDPGLAGNQQQVIDLLSQHKLEWRSLYGIQELTLFGSLARNERSRSASGRSDCGLKGF